MTAFTSLPTSLKWASSVLAIAIVVRISAVIVAVSQAESVASLGVIRTYVFWAAVCVPVAALMDQVLRSIADYEVIRNARQRVRQD